MEVVVINTDDRGDPEMTYIAAAVGLISLIVLPALFLLETG